MLTILLVSMREGIEAFLIVAITLAYLRQSGRESLVPAVFAGTATAIALSFVAGWFFSQADNKPLWEGWLALVAAFLVLTMVIYMSRASKRMRGEIAAKVEAAATRPGTGAWVGIFAFVLLMIVREGMETAAVLTTLALESGSRDLLIGATLGMLAAGALAWAWSRYGARINLKRFFQVTSLFLILFTLQLFIYAFHEFSEAGALPGLDNEWWHLATEPYGPEGLYGEWLTYLMVLIPAGWLLVAWLQDRSTSNAPRPA
jgi:high-affinity iron transporter